MKERIREGIPELSLFRCTPYCWYVYTDVVPYSYGGGRIG